MNMVGYVGNLTADIELKQTPQGVPIATFTVAVKRPFSKDITDFFRCVAWRNTAEFVSKYFHKGDYIAVKGYNTSRTYEKTVGGDSVKIQTVELLVEKADFCGSKGAQQSGNDNEPYHEPHYNQDTGNQFTEVPDDDDLPF